MRRLLKNLFSRVVIFGLAILVQLIILILIIWHFSNYFAVFYGVFALISLVAVLIIVNSRGNPAYKIAWIIPIMLFPIFGGLFYLMFGGNKTSRKSKRKMELISQKTTEALGQNQDILDQLDKENQGAANQARYIYDYSYYPVYTGTTSHYLSSGEMKFECLLEELKKAERYIFLEYFIIEQGTMWSAILDILVEKAQQGVDVRVIYDDVGCLLKLPYGYDRYLESLGIKCRVFNPFRPVLSVRLNNRDHRKIAVIDGHTAITGGINLADEYINEVARFGHWKDTSILIQGEAVWNLVVMFLALWDWLCGIKEDYEEFKPLPEYAELFTSDGYVQPFADSPLDDESVSQSVFLNMIGGAKRYVYINTPYLILDNEMTTALCLAAKRGVDVRIVTPRIGDRWFVHAVTRSNYEVLIEAGVRIYEYTPGFMHAKTFVVDDQFAVVGTINLDYRSLYLHFECGVWLYKTQSVMEIKEDYLQTLAVSQLITLEECHNVKWYKKLARSLLRLFAPLM
jgi:cardiolipin synthase